VPPPFSGARAHVCVGCACFLLLASALQIFYLVPNAIALRKKCIYFERFSSTLICVLLEWLCWGAILSLFLVDIHWRLPRTANRSTFIERITLPPLKPPPPTRPDASYLDLGWDVRLVSTKARASQTDTRCAVFLTVLTSCR
jgi:hypothetical protein